MSTTEQNTPADPIAALAAQGVDLNQPADQAAASAGAEAGAPAPGTGQQSSPAPAAAPPAEAQNTDTEQPTGGPPDNVPYSRFKEVNDQLRAFKELEAFGYDADSLRQLATWGAQFDQNPVDSWMAVAKELGDDLPPDIREAVAAHLGTQEGTVQPQQANQDGDEPTWAKELKQRLDSRDAADEQAARAEMLNSLVSKWKAADQKDGIPTIADEKIYTYISGNAPAATNEDELFDLARKEFLDTREFILQGSVVKPGDTRAPVTVPGSGAPVQEAPPRPKTLAEATAAALADVSAGTLNTEGVTRRE